MLYYRKMEVISSRQNPTIKHVAKLLSSGKYRHKQNLAVVEGIHLAESVVHSCFSCKQVIVAESALKNREATQIMDRLSVAPTVIRDSLFAAMSDISAEVGILVVFELPVQDIGTTLDTDALLLEDVQDPGNVGAILRTAAAAGVKSVYLSNGCASAWSPKVLRAGMGAQFSVDIFEAADLEDVIKNSSVPVLATSLQASESLYQQQLRQPVAWLFGNEGQGVSSQLEALVSRKIIIPQADTTVESLNVAAAAAVCLFEQVRQRSV